MSTHQLFGSIYSTCTKNVLTAAAESGVNINLIDVHFEKGGHKQPEHLARQPFGMI